MPLRIPHPLCPKGYKHSTPPTQSPTPRPHHHLLPHQHQQGVATDSIHFPPKTAYMPLRIPHPLCSKGYKHTANLIPHSPTSPPLTAPPAPARCGNRQREHPKDNLLTGRLIPRQSIPSRPLHIGHIERGLANIPRRANRTRYVRPHHLT